MSIFRKVQFLANIAIIIIAILFILVAVKQLVPPSAESTNNLTPKNVSAYSSSKSTASGPTPPTIGHALPLQNINWKENKKTLVFYISATCHFCKDSIPFYQRLIKENSKLGLSFIAILPQELDEAKKYLKSENIDISQVYKASFASIGVTGTPTLLLVDENGIISEFWRGRLSPEKEAEVLSKISS
ncbi:hypothetical protein BH10ACI3_BH10ACI3_11180 [soil metagenome]